MLISRDSGKRYSGSVLLVEDNPVNQKVAVRFLERMGCRVRVADNGAEGVRAYQEMAFDIVLMDLQMPVMDGLTATRRIREIETGGRATPIVALTANAMAGQLERCMEAGMTDFLTKPLDIGRLHETLERFGLRADSATETGADASSSGVGGVPVDLGRLHEVTEGDAAFAYELAQTFVSSGAQVMQEVRDAMGAFDRPALGRAAHKLKGASSNVHAIVLRDLSHTLETQAGAMDQPRLKELIEQLEEEFTRAAQFLQQQAPEPTAQTG
jgi:CheY-like chemotaxis protein